MRDEPQHIPLSLVVLHWFQSKIARQPLNTGHNGLVLTDVQSL